MMLPVYSPTEARAMHDAGVLGVPPFVALTGRPLPSRAFYGPAPAPLRVTITDEKEK